MGFHEEGLQSEVCIHPFLSLPIQLGYAVTITYAVDVQLGAICCVVDVV
jgi:hypothetical protein